MKDQVITPQDVDRYWKAQVRAIDRWEWLVDHNCNQDTCDSAWEEVESWTRLAEEIQKEYSQQYDELNKVMPFGEYKPTLDPKTCNHQNAFTTYDDIDGKLQHCPDCNATLDEDGQIVQVVDEIPY